MPRASKRFINRQLDEDLEEYFSILISNLNNPKEIESFFNDFLTSEEKLMLTKRLMLHLMLENNYKDFEIEQVLKISGETVRVHRNIWSKGGTAYKKVIGKIAGKQKTKLFWKKIEKMLKPLELALEAKTNMKSRARLASADFN